MANANEKYAYNYFRSITNADGSRRYSDVAAQGIVGNLSHESGGLNTSAINRGDGNDGSDSIGIAQWNSTRAQQLKLFAAGRGASVNNLDTQLAFVDHELQTTERGTLTRLTAATTREGAVGAFLGYERPQGYSAANPSASMGYADRMARADGVAGAPTYDLSKYKPGDTLPDGSIYAGGGAGGAAVNPNDPSITQGNAEWLAGKASQGIAEAIDKQTGGSLAAASTALSNLGALTADLFGRGAIVLVGVIILGAGLAWLVLNSRVGNAIPQVAAVKRVARGM